MMFERHPSQHDFEDLLSPVKGSGQSNARPWVVRHLLADCTTCRKKLQTMGWQESRLERLLNLRTDLEETLPGKAVSKSFNYDAAFAGAEKALDDFFAVGCVIPLQPEELLAELASLESAEQERRLGSDPRFADPQWVQWLIDRGFADRYKDPGQMLYLARLARIAADACSVASLGSLARLEDLRTRAWGHYGNSLRVCGQLAEAEKALREAARHQQEGTGDPLLRAQLWQQIASLHTYQRRFDSAIDLAAAACEIHRELGETHRLASSLVHRALASLYAGDPASALSLLEQAIPLVDHEEEPHLLLAACHNLIRCYIDLDRPEQAMTLYFKVRDLYSEFKDEIILLRVAWQEGQLLRELGHLKAAEKSLLRARKGFFDRSLSYEVAVVSLDLAAIYVRLGASEELKQTVTQTMPIFRSLRIGRESLGALIQLQKVADQQQQALDLIQSVSHRLQNVQQKTLLQ